MAHTTAKSAPGASSVRREVEEDEGSWQRRRRGPVVERDTRAAGVRAGGVGGVLLGGPHPGRGERTSARARARGARTSAQGARTHWVPVRTHTIRARARATDTRASAPLVSGEGRRCA